MFLVADQRPPLVLCGAREHLLDERYVGDDPGHDLTLYAGPFFRYAREVLGGRVAGGAREVADPVRCSDDRVAQAIDNFDMLHRSKTGFTGPSGFAGWRVSWVCWTRPVDATSSRFRSTPKRGLAERCSLSARR